MNLEWFVSAVLAAACITVLSYFEEKTPLCRKTLKVDYLLRRDHSAVVDT